MNPDVSISLPNDILKTMTFEHTLFLPDNEKEGLAVFSEIENDRHLMRIYHLQYDEDDEAYNFIQELTTFNFQNRNDVDDLIKRLPTMSGIEMLLMLHPISS